MDNKLVVNKKYLLRTVNGLGNEQPRDRWIEAVWTGNHLVDGEGVYWDEWLDTPEDIFETN